MAKGFKAPDVKGPRFREEAVNIIDKKFIDSFKEKYPKHKGLTETKIRQIIKAFNEKVFEEVIETRDGVELPEGLGQIFIGTCKNVKKENIDFAKSMKYGVLVTNKNWETDGKLAKIFYTSYSTKYKFANRECWEFVACRNFKRSVAKTYPENWTMYVEVQPDKKLRALYQAIRIGNKNDNKVNAQLKSYNEFDL